MKDISQVLWFNGAGLRPYQPEFADRIFKWNLIEKDGKLIVMAMPRDAGLDFHPELLDAVCEQQGWDKEKVKVLGGGVRLNDGEIIHKSTHFGRIPQEYQKEVLRHLSLSV